LKYRELLAVEGQGSQVAAAIISAKQAPQINEVAGEVGTSSTPNVTAATALNAPEFVRSKSSGDEEYEKKKLAIAQMMETIKQNQDQCFFYLEASDWDVEKAIEMFVQMGM
jgi:hypothetical protein